MKRCPTCNRTFTDRNLSFCIDDGTPLVAVPEAEEPRIISPESQSVSGSPPTPQSQRNNWNAPTYQPPGSYVPPTSKSKRSAWPWVIGILALVLMGIVGLAVAAAIILPRMLLANANRSNPSINVNVGNGNDANANSNSNSEDSNSNSNLNGNANSGENDDSSRPPSEPAQVLADLTDLENEWTRANINADKKALDRILADDFVGKVDGKSQGKAEYLRTIERDTAIETWNFDDLKLDLKGDHSTLTGIVKFVVNGQEVKFHFIDKFVWRDGRWQATNSELNPIK